MSDQNNQTLRFYENHADAYEQCEAAGYSTKKGQQAKRNLQIFLSQSLKTIPKTANLFEIGSGYGRDALFIQSLGYKIQTSDAVDSFMNRLRQNGFTPVKFNLVTDTFTDTYDYILANAVLVHFPKNEIKKSVKKIYKALKSNGIFTFCLKRRINSEEDHKTNIAGEKRYFAYWDADEIKDILEKTGFKIVLMEQVEGIRSCWINVIAKKD